MGNHISEFEQRKHIPSLKNRQKKEREIEVLQINRKLNNVKLNVSTASALHIDHNSSQSENEEI